MGAVAGAQPFCAARAQRTSRIDARDVPPALARKSRLMRLARCDLVRCDLVGCDLVGCDLVGCDLVGCDLVGCDPRGQGGFSRSLAASPAHLALERERREMSTASAAARDLLTYQD